MESSICQIPVVFLLSGPDRFIISWKMMIRKPLKIHILPFVKQEKEYEKRSIGLFFGKMKFQILVYNGEEVQVKDFWEKIQKSHTHSLLHKKQ